MSPGISLSISLSHLTIGKFFSLFFQLWWASLRRGDSATSCSMCRSLMRMTPRPGREWTLTSQLQLSCMRSLVWMPTPRTSQGMPWHSTWMTSEFIHTHEPMVETVLLKTLFLKLKIMFQEVSCWAAWRIWVVSLEPNSYVWLQYLILVFQAVSASSSILVFIPWLPAM